MVTVLVVDDRAANRELARATLDLGGHRVVEASDGRRALDLARRIHPDVILADVVMPGMDGYELVHNLRTDGATADIPVVLYTANYRPDEAEPLARAYGVTGVVAKSAAPDQLLAALEDALRSRPVDQTPPDPALATEHLRTVNAKLVEKVLALDESEARFTALAEVSPVGIAIGDHDLNATYVNPSLIDIVGHPAHTLLGAGWRCCLPADHNPTQDASAGPPPGTVTYHGETELAHGRRRWLHTVVRQLPDTGHEPGGFVAIVNDLTPIVEAEKRRHDAERQREAETARQIQHRFDSLTRFSGAIAHDFNNILNVILSFGEFAADAVRDASGTTLTAEDADAVGEDLRHVAEAARRAAHLAQQLLTFGGRANCQATAIDLNAVIRDTLELINAEMGEQITITTALDPTLRTVRGDPDQMSHVLRHLAANARDAMPRGGRLSITTAYDAGRVHLTLTDTGEGMSPDIVERAAEPFFSTKPKGPSAGLGLAIAYGTVTQTGGALAIDSTVGHGTTIHIELPATDEPAHPDQPPNTSTGAAPSGHTILLADDEDGIRHAAARILTRAGYHVLAAVNGEAALALARSHTGPIHALLTDVVMPGMNGPQLAEAIQQSFPTIPVVFMSGYAEPLMTEHGILPPNVTLISKPFTKTELLSTVATATTTGHAPKQT